MDLICALRTTVCATGRSRAREKRWTLIIVVAANLLLENFVEPKMMGRTLDIHPIVVLVVTALGGLLAASSG